MKEWSTRAEIVYRRTYSRPLEDGKFEVWEETINRVIGHQQWLWERALTHKVLPGMPLKDITDNMIEWVSLDQKQMLELSELKGLMIERKVVTSGRSLWLAGTEVSRKQEASQFNCAARYVETVYDVVDLFHLLLMGSGTGFKTIIGSITGFRHVIPILDIIPSTRKATEKGRETNEETFIDGVWTIQVGDSARAWATSIGKILAGKYKANKLVIDLTEVRGPGARLAGFGWISSGSGPLGRAFKAIFEILNRKAGCLLSKIDLLDIMNHLGTVLSSRRSAQIAFIDYGSLEWEEFADAKKECFAEPYTHRQQSNNSIIFQTKPSKQELTEVFDRMIKNGGSEPGFINGQALKERAPYAELLNPCFPDTLNVLTKSGLQQIKDINIGDVIWSSEGWTTITNKFSNGIKSVNRYKTTAGEIDLTTNHKILEKGIKIEVKDAHTIDILAGNNTVSILNSTDIFNGVMYGDGYLHSAANKLMLEIGKLDSDYYTSEISSYILDISSIRNGSKTHYTNCTLKGIPKTPFKKVPAEYKYGSADKKASFLRGIYSANGSVLQGAKRITYKSVSKQLILDIQLMLSSLGIYSYYTINRSKNVKFDNGEYLCKESYDLNITYSRDLFRSTIGFIQKYKVEKLEAICKIKPTRYKKSYELKEVEYLGDMEVWDITVDNKSHTFWANGFNLSNCAEVALSASGGFCCLTETDVTKFVGDTAGLLHTLHLISRANYRQTVVDFDDGILQESWKLNNDFQHLCGVSLTGVARRDDLTSYDLKRMRDAAISGVNSMAYELGLPRPANTTVQKPSGSVSKVMDSWEGIHKPLGRYIFNWILFSVDDPMLIALQRSGYKIIDHPSQKESRLVCVPVNNGDYFDKEEVTRKDGTKEILEINKESAIKQLERYKKYMTWWTDMNTSNTISYDISEVPEIIDWLMNNWDVYVGVSFLFRTDPTMCAADLGYPYLPQEVVSKSKYDEYLLTLTEIDWDNTESFEEIDSGAECASGMCPIK